MSLDADVFYRRSRSRSPRMKRERSRSPMNSLRSDGKKKRVYVRNLPFTLKWMELKDLMKKCGSVEHVEIFSDSDGRSKGCAVVEYSTADDAARAVSELDGREVDGRTIHLREDQMDDDTYRKQLQNLKDKSRSLKETQNSGGGNRRDSIGMPSQPLGGLDILARETAKQQMFAILTGANQDQANSTVFVSNLDYDLTWQTLKEKMRRAGNCLRCDIKSDQDQKSRGFGTVVFDTPLEALTAIALYNGMSFGNSGRQIACRLDRVAPLTILFGHLGVEYEKFNISHLVQLQAQAVQSSQASALSGLGAFAGQGLSGLSGQASQLSGLGGANLSALSQLMGSGGLNAAPSMPMSGSSSRRRDDSPPRRSGGGDGGRSGGGRSAPVNSSRAVFVRNLPFSVTWQELKDQFKKVGKVTRADISKDDQGRSKGYGLVEFDTENEAKFAVEKLNGIRMDGREIQVKMDRT